MSVKKVKTPAKIFTSNLNELEAIIVRAIDRIADSVGSSLGPNGRIHIIESELPGIPNTNTKDGVTIFRALGSSNAYEHLIIEQTRDVAIRTVNEAGDGTTTATIIAASLIKGLFQFCKQNPKYSPQKITRIINGILQKKLIPGIHKASIKITNKNKHLLEKVATISANGDVEMGKAVIDAFDKVGYGASSHVTIQELSGPSSYKADLIEGFPITKGYEESIGKFHPAFINDQAHQRCILDKPLFILFDGQINDIIQVKDTFQKIGEEYVNGNSEFKNVVIVAHRFSDQVLGELALNFPNPGTINIIPLTTPMTQLINCQLHFLMDLSAFTGAKIFDINNALVDANPTDFGQNMEKIEIYRFRTTITGNPDPTNIEYRAGELEAQKDQIESKIEKEILEERLGKLTSGIAQLKIFGSSNGELKEKADRAEDAVCSVRASISHGCVPGGCRVLINLALSLQNKDDPIIHQIIIPALFSPFYKLLDNAGYSMEEMEAILIKMFNNPNIVYDVENAKFGDPKKNGILDATLAVEQALRNAVSISSVMGTLGGIVAFPRDNQLENQNTMDEYNFQRSIDNAQQITNEANQRP
jgi:chaperonin GroEL